MSNADFSFSGNIPEIYDRYLGPYIFEPFAKDISSRVKLPVKKVLEIAAGTGRVTRHIAEKVGREAQFVATDLNPDMLAIAKQRVNAPNIKWMQANAQELPFEDNSFNCVICQFGIMFFPDKQKGINEAYRVLKPGGQLLFNTWDRLENNITSYISKHTVTDFLKENPPEFYRVPYSMFNPAELKAYADIAGFTKVTVKKITLTGESPSAMDIATGFIEGNPIITEIINQDPTLVEKIKASVVEQIHRQVSKDPVRSELNVWICEAYK